MINEQWANEQTKEKVQFVREIPHPAGENAGFGMTPNFYGST
jgi:hypothetical protein